MLKHTMVRTAAILMIAAALLATPALADNHWIKVDGKTTLAGKALKAGSYKVKIVENGGSAELQLYKGKKMIASAKGKMVDAPGKIRRDELVYKPTSDGGKELVQLYLAGKAKGIILS
ncbi:hypothetical protein ABI59_21590 [Acidobacteria bacterium Mor1]|nr:hypothetical protein ABI59_21590 [Acidobacteria bacterium Mor1]